MEKSLQAAKIEELLKTYKHYQKDFRELVEDGDNESIKSELFWIEVIVKDLKWALNDSKY